MARVSRDGRFQLMNDAFCELLGYEREELLNLTTMEITHPDDRIASLALSKQTWAEPPGSQLGTMQKRYLRKDGSTIHAEIHLTTINDASGNRQYSLVQVLSIEEQWHRLQVETAHRKVLELLTEDKPLEVVLCEVIRHAEAGSENLRAAILLADEESNYFVQAFAPSLPEGCLRPIVGSEIREGFGSCATGIVRGERIIVEDVLDCPLWQGFEAVAKDANISSCWSQPIAGEEGLWLGSFSMMSPMPRKPTATEIVFIEGMANLVAVAVQRGRVLESLRMSRARFRTLVEHAPEAIVLFDYDVCKFIEANERVRDIFKISPAALLASSLTNLSPAYQPDGRSSTEAIVEKLEEAKSGASPVFNWVCLDVDGNRVQCEIRLVRLATKTGTVIRGSLINVGNRLAAEQALRSSEASLRATLDSIGDAVVAVDSQGHINLFNPVAAKILGCDKKTAIGQQLSSIFTLHDPNSRAELDPYHIRDRATSSEPHIILISTSGNETYVSERVTPILGVGGSVNGTVFTFRDVTQQRATQERRLQARKLEAIGQLAGGVAHDFNNLLTSILGNAELLCAHGENAIHDSASMIAIAARRAADLTDQLLRFSHSEPSRHELVDIHLLIREACQLLTHSIDKRIEIVTYLDAPLVNVPGDASQLQNCFLNLGLNARDALNGTGSITISTRNVGRSRRSVEISFMDTGSGIDPTLMEHIFEPFFTTKEVGSGTGLGLAGAYGIVRSHGGHIEVSSQPGDGACFVITLPLAEGQAPLERETITHTKRGMGRILVIDDEDLVRNFVVRALESFGYEALAVENGILAEELLEAGAFDLVILDLVMPLRSGLDTFHALTAIDPDIPILVASGFSRDNSVEELLSAGAAGFLHKPFQLGELAGAIDGMLRLSRQSKPK